jgi:hypothetical protein
MLHNPLRMERQSLATFVASIESRTVTAPAQHPIQRPGRAFPLLLVSALTLFAVALDGYHPYAEDGGLYLAGIERLLNPSLFPYATSFVLEPMHHSLFAPTVAEAVRLTHLPLPAVMFALYLASIWTTLFAAWMLASRCWMSHSARVAAVTLLACWLTLPVAGTALLFMDPYTTARSFSTPCMVLALVGVLEMTALVPNRKRVVQRGMTMWAISIVLAAAMHPLMATYAFGSSSMLLVLRSPNRAFRLYGTAALALIAMTVAAYLQFLSQTESANYICIALTRTYWFPTQWRWFELAGLILPLVLLTTVARGKSLPSFGIHFTRSATTLAHMAIAVGLTSILVALLFARTATLSHLVARLQPLRVFQIVYLVMILTLGAQLGGRLLRRSAVAWATAMLLLGGIMLLAQRMDFPHSNHLELPGIAPRNQWTEAFLWIRDNTPVDALFALDADYINAPGEDAQCFRAIAQRSALADYSKDGGEASIAPELTEQWLRSQLAQIHLSEPSTTDGDRLSALRSLGVNWVVLQSEAVTRFDCPYRNPSVKICTLQ